MTFWGHLPLSSTSHHFLWFRPLIFKQQNWVLLALLPCLKLPPSYGNTQRSGCFELFFPVRLAALLSFSNLEHKTPLQKTEAKPQPRRNCWISLLKTTLQKAARCFFAHHCYLGNAFITEKWDGTYVFREALLMQGQRDYFHDWNFNICKKKKTTKKRVLSGSSCLALVDKGK